MNAFRKEGRKAVLLSAVLLCGVVALVLALRMRAPQAAPAPEAKVAAQPAAEPQHVPKPMAEAYARWGGALCSASEDGAHFFDLRRAIEFKERAGDLAKFVVHLRSRALLPDPAAASTEILRGDGEQVVLMQFTKVPKADERAELKEAGVELLGYVDGLAWHARGTAADLREVRGRPDVRALAAMDPRDKVSPAVFASLSTTQSAPERVQRDGGRLHFQLLAHPGTRKQELAAALPAGAQVAIADGPKSSLGPRFTFDATPEVALALMSSPRAHYLEFPVSRAERRDGVLDAASNVNDVRDGPLALDGTGVTVGIREIDMITEHADFTGRFTPIDTGGVLDTTGHATQVTGQVGADGSTKPAAKGIAPAVELEGYDVNDPILFDFDTTDIYTMAPLVRISNHSYGPGDPADANGTYTSESADWDDAVYDNNALVFFASGEFSTNQFGRIDFIVGAKNVIDVTATNDTAKAGDDEPPTAKADGLATFVDFGPMDDGRIKPDLAVNGVGVTLVSGASGSAVNSGTSFACPGATGMMALIFQRYNDLFTGEPGAALGKAILLNSATDLGNAGPDAKYGYGIANVEKAISVLDQHFADPSNNVLMEGSLDNLDPDFVYTVTIPAGLPEVKFMLCWMDPHKTPETNPALVNNLDLEVTSPSLVKHFPFKLNVLSPNALATNSGANAADNVEQIVIANPEGGTYTVTVKATLVPSGPQEFGVCCVKDPGMRATISAAPVVVAPVDPHGAVVGGKLYLPTEGVDPVRDVDFTATIAGGEGPFTLEWDFDGDDVVDATDDPVASSPFTHGTTITYADLPATYTVKLTVTDSATPTPNVAVAFLIVEVLDPPTADLFFTPDLGTAPLDVFFSGAGSAGEIASYIWDFGDGSSVVTTTGSSIIHTYDTVDIFFPSLTVVDVCGQTSDPADGIVETEKRIVEVFPHKLNANVTFNTEKGKLKMVLIVSELALSSQEARQTYASGKLEGQEWEVLLDGIGYWFFTLDAKGREKQEFASIKVNLNRKGTITVIAKGLDVVDGLAFSGDGFNEFQTTNDPKDPTTWYELPVTVETPNADYNATYPVIWKNNNGLTGKAKAPNLPAPAIP
ncbi:MAG: S8 family serine peptidase [Planctomycetes bacterium]|nr:S8 family serine peptidase [Planctomycetota bacterium]